MSTRTFSSNSFVAGGAFGPWSSPITTGVPYRATTDGIVVVFQQTTGSGGGASITIKSDSNPVPTTIREYASTTINGGASFVTGINATCPVKAGDYVLVTVVNTLFADGAIYWIPWLPIASPGSSSEKKVGAGESTDVAWHNIQYPFVGTAGSDSSDYSIWNFNSIAAINSPSFTQIGVGEFVTFGSTFSAGFPDFDEATGEYRFDATKQLVFQCAARTIATANEDCGIGFDPYGVGAASKIFSSQGTNVTSVGFVRSNAGAWYARVADGAAFTETPITVTADANHVFRCEYDPGNATPQARYYVDGALVATITTNLPTAVTSAVAFSAGNDGGCETINRLGCPSFAVEL